VCLRRLFVGKKEKISGCVKGIRFSMTVMRFLSGKGPTDRAFHFLAAHGMSFFDSHIGQRGESFTSS
jgi:hypothetical protein